ncbi:MAG: glycosyltransferase [Pseudomonadales bacterium]
MKSRVKHVAIATKYRHHTEEGGYIRLAHYTHPESIIGIDEHAPPNIFYRRYKWLYELNLPSNIDFVHVYYAEEYLRFSPLKMKIPVVATFHQPPSLLEREVLTGDYSGRVGKFTHSICKTRFKKLAGAIILEENQRPVLEKVMSSSKIHLIPHGIDRGFIIDATGRPRKKKHVLTVGNWQRDWAAYERILQIFLLQSPNTKFALVNRTIERSWLDKFKQYDNFNFFPNVDDNELRILYEEASLVYLPLKEGTANNAVIEALANGCPVVATSVFLRPTFSPDCVRLYSELGDGINYIKEWVNINDDQRKTLQGVCIKNAKKVEWSKVADQTLQVYQSCIEGI